LPTYDYQCRDCGNTIEVIHSMTEEGPSTCEVCGGSLRRILHPAGIIFKGSGFYKTDSRSSSSASVPASSTKSTAAAKESGTSASTTAEKGGKASDAKTSGDGSSSSSAGKAGD
jgi:putative FmdB family regulatory protein